MITRGLGVRPGNLPRAREFWRGGLSALALVYFPFQAIALGYQVLHRAFHGM
jgi:hypothetical protein